MKNYIVLLLLTFSTFKLYAQASVETDLTPDKSISVQPMRNDFNLKAGQSKEIKIIINNRLQRRMQFNVYLGDWSRDTLGKHVYSQPGTEPHSCARWITIDKKFIEVDTGQKGIINLKLQVPDSADAVKEMKWAMLFIEAVEEAKAPELKEKEMRSEILPKTRFGVHIYQTPPNVTEKEIKLYSFKPIADKPNSFRIIAENTGKVQITCKAHIELSSLADNKKITVPNDEIPLFPEQRRYFDFALPANTPKGKYTLVGVIDAGNDMDIEAAQLVINVE